jgi:fumarate hydratase class II
MSTKKIVADSSFPTAMHIAAVCEINESLIPALTELRDAMEVKRASFEHVVKIGRTHLQDATPLTLGQEFSGYVCQLDRSIVRAKSTLEHLSMLAQGGTAVGTVCSLPSHHHVEIRGVADDKGLNTKAGFDVKVADEISNITGHKFITAPNKVCPLSIREM